MSRVIKILYKLTKTTYYKDCISFLNFLFYFTLFKNLNKIIDELKKQETEVQETNKGLQENFEKVNYANL